MLVGAVPYIGLLSGLAVTSPKRSVSVRGEVTLYIVAKAQEIFVQVVALAHPCVVPKQYSVPMGIAKGAGEGGVRVSYVRDILVVVVIPPLLVVPSGAAAMSKVTKMQPVSGLLTENW